MEVLLYDGTFEGLFTCIYYGFYSEKSLEGIYADDEFYSPLLLGEVKEIKTNEGQFTQVRDAIIKKIDLLALQKIYMTFLSNQKDKGILIYKYLKIAFKLGKDVHSFLNLDEVRLVDMINKRVSCERHKFYGFVRFKNIDDKFLYSAIEPDNDIVELLCDHFSKRFSNECWIIHDISRNKAAVYDKSSYEITTMPDDVYEKLENNNDEYESLWTAYFASTNIEERNNLRLQRQMMPKRYWKHIFETDSK